MTLTDRDRKLVLVLVPIVVLVGYWFLLLSPQRKDASAAADRLAKQERRLTATKSQLAQLNSAKSTFAADYGSLVRLGKAVPSAVDMPTLLVQLNAAAEGTGIDFTKIKAGERDESSGSGSSSSGSQPPKAPGSGDGSQPAAAGGQGAASGPGKAAEGAGNATNNANSASSNAESQGGGQSSGSSKQGGLPVGGGSSASGGAAAGSGSGAPAGLDTVPLEFQFDGRFFRLADFFHDLKRFVQASNRRIAVSGRLLTIDALKFTSTQEEFPNVTAEVKATVYLAPKREGATAGASPSGPTPPAATPASSTAPNPTSGP
jgi:Tfp pilus assembly protein PilO